MIKTTKTISTHWGRMVHIRVTELTIIGADNGLSPSRRQPIFWTNAGILLIGPPKNKLQWNLNRNSYISIKKIHLKMSSGKWRPFCLGLNVLSHGYFTYILTCFHVTNCIFTWKWCEKVYADYDWLQNCIWKVWRNLDLDMLATSLAIGGSPHKDPVMRHFGAIFVVSLNKLFNKQSRYRRFGTPWRACDVTVLIRIITYKEIMDDSQVKAFIIIDIYTYSWWDELDRNKCEIFQYVHGIILRLFFSLVLRVSWLFMTNLSTGIKLRKLFHMCLAQRLSLKWFMVVIHCIIKS